MAEMQGAQPDAAPGQGSRIAGLTNLAGAAVSMLLIVGVGIWGYKLLVRDVSGVPVVRAAEGPMRVQPEDPGGRQALNQGLSVNAVAADGTAEKPADRLILAPKPLDLTLEDAPASELAAARPKPKPEPTPTAEPADKVQAEATPSAEAGEPAPAAGQPVQLAAVEALATELTDQGDLAEAASVEPADDPVPETEDLAAREPAVEAAIAEALRVEGGIGRSLRPQLRPVSLGQQARQQTATAAPSQSGPRDIDPEAIPAGTRLAQLGAFESADIARQEWKRLDGRFGEYLEGKDRVIQKAQSGGRTFYRLRAIGFEDLSDARRFCSALVAENAECIPVVTR
ncbi:sporulation related protein [Roseovarius halotolerans]|uniref:Sporulation related domain protein n=1 Tax=Roseovarius halotolerans TaxID=505353 RepID=A0A1X6YQJ1_9RHOB|nr:SPOR domain-containing protein [Roseovarius halotolerans]RKT34062.1 sporulation related protein [Roseovarius halotolerans]SLN27558.1 Sporulation related domain protein [Roseovarius halotolerans]